MVVPLRRGTEHALQDPLGLADLLSPDSGSLRDRVLPGDYRHEPLGTQHDGTSPRRARSDTLGLSANCVTRRWRARCKRTRNAVGYTPQPAQRAPAPTPPTQPTTAPLPPAPTTCQERAPSQGWSPPAHSANSRPRRAAPPTVSSKRRDDDPLDADLPTHDAPAPGARYTGAPARTETRTAPQTPPENQSPCLPNVRLTPPRYISPEKVARQSANILRARTPRHSPNRRGR